MERRATSSKRSDRSSCCTSHVTVARCTASWCSGDDVADSPPRTLVNSSPASPGRPQAPSSATRSRSRSTGTGAPSGTRRRARSCQLRAAARCPAARRSRTTARVPATYSGRSSHCPSSSRTWATSRHVPPERNRSSPSARRIPACTEGSVSPRRGEGGVRGRPTREEVPGRRTGSNVARPVRSRRSAAARVRRPSRARSARRPRRACAIEASAVGRAVSGYPRSRSVAAASRSSTAWAASAVFSSTSRGSPGGAGWPVDGAGRAGSPRTRPR